MVYHERALHNYFILCHRKYNGQHNRSNMHAAHIGKVGRDTDEHTTAFPYSNLLYFRWHGIKEGYYNILVKTCFGLFLGMLHIS